MLGAIARRSSVGDTISDAIVLRNDRPAVSALLANGSAQIREETLDRLTEASVQETACQPAPVARPVLPAGAVRKLARFVADPQLQTLQTRSDLDAPTAHAAAEGLRRRIATGNPDPSTTRTAPLPPTTPAAAVDPRKPPGGHSN